MPITASQAKNASPKEKDYKLFDEKGMFLMVKNTGRKYWRMKYRFAGKQKTLSLGVFPEVSLKLAREKRDDARKLLNENTDPSAYKISLKHVATEANNILRNLQTLTGRGQFLFPSLRGGDKPMSENAVRVALRTMGYDNNTMTPHGFRAMARTLLDEVLDYRIEWIEQQLAHEVKDVNGRAYNRTKHLAQRATMMQHWANHLDELKAEAQGRCQFDPPRLMKSG